MTSGIGFDRGDDDIGALIEFDSPRGVEAFLGGSEHGFGQPGPDPGHSRPGCWHDLHAELHAEQPTDIIDQLPEWSLVVGFQFTVSLAECSRDRFGIRESGVEHAVGASVTEDRVEGDGSDGDHQVGFDQLDRQVDAFTRRRCGQVLSIIGLFGIVDPPAHFLGDVFGQLSSRVEWFGRGLSLGLEHEYVFGFDVPAVEDIPDRCEDQVGGWCVAVQRDHDLVAGDHGLLERREVERGGESVLDRVVERFDLLRGIATSDQAVGIDFHGQSAFVAVSHVEGV